LLDTNFTNYHEFKEVLVRNGQPDLAHHPLTSRELSGVPTSQQFVSIREIRVEPSVPPFALIAESNRAFFC
jgi:hypothetical protein